MPKTNLSDLIDWIERNDDFAVVPHVSPDGDALGSALALNRILTLIGKRSCVICHEDAPKMFRFIPDSGTVKRYSELDRMPESALFVDVASPDRAGDAIGLMHTAKHLAVVDHHATNHGFGDVHFIDPEASSTGELIAEILDAFHLPMDETMAVWIYTAISTDTGNFGYSNTSPSALRVTARCIEAGLKIDEISRLLFRSRSLRRAQMMGYALSNLQFALDGRLAYCCLSEAVFKQFDASHADTEGIVSYINEIEGIEVAIVAEERGGGTKLSLRSSGLIDVSRVVVPLGGGGHERAAGVTLSCPPQEAIEIVRRAIEREYD